jgi:hypothetical protein
VLEALEVAVALADAEALAVGLVDGLTLAEAEGVGLRDGALMHTDGWGASNV